MELWHFISILGLLFLISVTKVHGNSVAEIEKAIDMETKAAGQEGRLNCTVSGVEQTSGAAVMWAKVGERTISRGQTITRFNPLGPKGQEKYRVFITRKSGSKQIYTLAVRRLVKEDSGEYECRIFLQGVPSSTFPRSVGKLVVQLPPSLDDSFTTPLVQVIEGEDALLKCDADGLPKPVISWSRANGKALPGGQQTIFGTKLLLKKVDTSYSGVYRCKADNNVRPLQTIDITLQIRTKPVAIPFRAKYGQARDKNLEVELTCIISGDPRPDLFWYYITDNKQRTMKLITDDYKHEVHKIAMYPGHNRKETDQWLTLRIMQLQANDYGNYMCLGKNMYGSGNATMQLYSTPTCQGALCDFESRDAGASAVTVSVMLFCMTIALAVLLGRNPT